MVMYNSSTSSSSLGMAYAAAGLQKQKRPTRGGAWRWLYLPWSRFHELGLVSRHQPGEPPPGNSLGIIADAFQFNYYFQPRCQKGRGHEPTGIGWQTNRQSWFSGYTTGIVKRKSAPESSTLSAQIFPPWASTICLHIESPSPVPPPERALSAL